MRARNTYGVERRGVECRVDMVRTGNSVGSKEGNDLEGREATSIVEAGQDRSHVILRLGNEAVDGGGSGVGATGKELELGCSLWRQSDSLCPKYYMIR